MNLLLAAPSWLAVLLVLCLAAAAIEDTRRLRISNLTSLDVLAGALVAMAIAGPSSTCGRISPCSPPSWCSARSLSEPGCWAAAT